ncbi:ubiquitin ligase complex subunit HRD3 [Rhodotorula paludigena]|uniref:ubiquitin ligase complex subunit HRD3 n=1 Tax=Rhodotorula paludigena TaxID=86838 RepID=UPI00316F10CC
MAGSTASTTSNEDPTLRQPAQLVFSSPNAQSPEDLFQLSLSLLGELTAHAPPPPPTPYSPHLVSTTSPLDDLEARLEGTVTGSVFRAVRSRVGALYGGKRKPAGGRDYSVRGAVQALRGAVESFAVDKVARVGNNKGPRGASPDGKGWKERLAGAKLKEAVVLEPQEVKEGLREVVELAREAADKGSVEALEFLGDLHLTGHLSLAANATEALAFYTRASELHGSPEAQYKLGFLYGSNFGGATGDLEGRGQQGSALLHYTFSALAGHVPASMTVGYRHWAGIGTKQSCKDALPWYKAAADAAVKAFNAGPPGGRHLPPPKIRLSDLNGGVYGPGASSARSSLITGGSNAQTQQEWDDLVEYHLFHAERGDAIFMYRLGKLYYQGFGAGGLGGVRYQPRGRLAVALPAGGIPHDELWDGGRDFRRAHKWFLRLTRKLWPADVREATWNPAWGPVGKGVRAGDAPRVGFYDAARDKRLEKVDDHTAMLAGLGAGSLGKMYLRGEGVAANYAKAFLWFQRGSKQGDRESNNGLGIMYRDGLGVERDLKKALQLFHAAAQLDLAEAQINLGKYHFGAGDYALATTYFEAAIRVDGTRWPDVFQAYYYLAELSARSATAAESCPVAVSFYKRVAERGDWDHEVWWEAERARERGDRRTALLGYWIMAERGYEAAQNNVASILDRDTQRYRLPLLDPVAPKTSAATKQLDRLALTYWTRSAAQDNVDALVKAGDYYYKGLGTEDGVPQMEKAASCYQSAATSRFSAMSMWKLGWMHETGQGVPKDFHLAKRHYDLAYDTSLDAGFPTTLSLIGLYARALYHAVFVGGDDELNALSLFGRDPDPDAVAGGGEQYGSLWSFRRMWRDIQRNWGYDPGPEPEAVPLHQEHEGQEPTVGEAGRAVERLGGGGGAEAGQQDMRAAQRAFEEAERFDDWREYHDGRGGLGRRHDGGDEDDEYWGDEEGDFGGTVAIVMLCMILAWLLYFRQQPQQQDRQPAPPVPAAAPVAHAQQPAQPQQTPAPTPTQPAPPERPR